MDTARWTYNQCVSLMKSGTIDLASRSALQQLRSRLLTNTNFGGKQRKCSKEKGKEEEAKERMKDELINEKEECINKGRKENIGGP